MIRFWKLGRGARGLWVRAWVMGVVCVCLLRVMGYLGVRGVLGRLAGPLGGFRAEEIAWTVGSSLGRVPRARCLAKALVGEALLLNSGYEAEICFGVTAAGAFGAHAWVEVGGVAVVGGPGEHVELRTVGGALGGPCGPGLKAGGKRAGARHPGLEGGRIGVSMRERA